MTSTFERLAEASAVRPSARQLAWQSLEFYGFIHFGMNTMTDREWGLGHEDPLLFNPDQLDAAQWVECLASAGMRGLILTCKHHDGFCLWPSAVTNHSVKASPWREGNGDLVAEVARACAAKGLKFGIYLSPWDRTEASYGSGRDYDDFFVAQLQELLINYGPIFSVWFDGANGEGPSGRRQLYDWDRYFEVVRRLQPDAVISVCGPDVRWCGNEAGHTRADEWSVVPASLRDAERTASNSQKIDDGKFSRQVKSDEDDLGSREALLASRDPLVWYPAEVNTSIRPGWFYHQDEDRQVRSVEELFNIYCGSVGGNASFLLNIPPNRHGLVAEPDRVVLEALGKHIQTFYARDRALTAKVSVADGIFDWSTGWSPLEGASPSELKFVWDDPVLLDALVLEEDIGMGQQIDGLRVEATTADGQTVLGVIGAVGYRRILRFEPVAASAVVIKIDGARGSFRLRPPMMLANETASHLLK